MNIIFLGAPGVGKGTQAQIISKKYNIPKLSTGDMLREAVSSGSDLGKEIDKVMSSGNLVSDDIVIKIIKERLSKEDSKRGFILDGFPRTIAQAEALSKLLDDLVMTQPLVIYMEAKEDELIKRISGRYSCAECGKGYHKVYNPSIVPGICDNCGAIDKFIQRKDDNEESVKNRLDIYYKQTKKLIEFYDTQGVLKRIDGMLSIDDIATSIDRILKIERR